MSLNRILGVFIFLLVVSSCSKEDDEKEEKKEETFDIAGTYKVDKVSKGGSDVAGSSGSFLVNEQSSDKYQLVSTKFTAGTWIKDTPLNLSGDVTKIDSKAYKVVVGNVLTTSAHKIDFSYSWTLSADEKTALVRAIPGISSINKIDFSDSNKKMVIMLNFKPATTQKITYEGKDYKGVIQKNQIKLAMNVKAVARVMTAMSRLQLAGTITGNDALKTEVKRILGSSSSADAAKKTVIEGKLDEIIAKVSAVGVGGVSQDDSEYIITLKK